MKIEQVPARDMMFRQEGPVTTVQGDAADKKGPRRFRMVAYSGEIVPSHWRWGKLAIDLEGLQIGRQRVAVLRDHSPSRIVGFTEQIAKEKEGIVAEGVFSEVTPDGREALAIAEEGFPWQASIFVPPLSVEQVEEGAETQVNGRTLTGPGTVFRKSVLREISFTAVGADENTDAVALAAGQDTVLVEFTEDVVRKLDMDLKDLTLDTLKAERADLVEAIQTEAVPGTDQLKAERDRVETITHMAHSFGLADYGKQLVAEGEAKDQAILRLKAQRSDTLAAQSPPSPGPNDDPDDTDADGAGLTGEERWTKDWDKSARLQTEFGSKDDYLAYKRADAQGLVGIFDKGK